jgi:hypothetical protein
MSPLPVFRNYLQTQGVSTLVLDIEPANLYFLHYGLFQLHSSAVRHQFVLKEQPILPGELL